MDLAVKIWNWFTEPPQPIADRKQRRQARLLASLLVVLIPMSMLAILLQVFTRPEFLQTFIIITAANIGLIVAYGLNRQGLYKPAAILMVGVTSLACFGAIVAQSNDILAYAFLIISIFLAGILLSLSAAASMIAINVTGVSVLLPILGVDPPFGNAVFAPIYLLITGALVLMAMRHRAFLEQDRQLELAESERNLRARAGQQAAIAELGQRALAGVELSSLMDTIVEYVAQVLSVDYCKVLQLLPDGKALVLRAGVGWKEGLVGQATVGAGMDSQAGFTLFSKDPVVVEDLRTETRFSGPSLLHDHGVVSGMSVIIHGRERPFGVLGVHTLQKQVFTKDDVNFFRAVANVLAEAIERSNTERAMRASEHAYRTLAENLPGIVYRVFIRENNRMQFFNTVAEEVTGYTSAELAIGGICSIEHLIVPEDRAGVVSDVKNAIADDRPFTVEYRLQAKDGSIHHMLEQGTPIRRPDGEPICIDGVIFDITERKRAEAALRESEASFAALAEESPNMIFINKGARIVYANKECEEIMGYSREEFYSADFSFMKLIAPESIEKTKENFAKHQQGEEVPPCEYKILTKDRRELITIHTTRLIDYQNGMAILGIVTDITDRKRTENRMRKLSSALEQTADSVIITDNVGAIEYVNPAFEVTTGYTREEVIGKDPRIVNSGQHDPAFFKRLWGAILKGDVFRDVFINRRKDGTIYYEEKTLTPLKDSKGNVINIISTGKDITEHMQTQERLHHLAHHDVVTDLPNRILFLERLARALARVHRSRRLLAVLFLDLDHFKNINDTLGHDVGDRLLQAMAVRLQSNVRDGDTVARLGGDEFTILVEDLTIIDDVGPLSKKLLDALSRPFELDDHELVVTASIGISLYPSDGIDSLTLLKNADTAMYRAKEQGRNTYEFYSADMSARAFERLTLETSLRHALEREEFRLHYQPQIDLDSGKIVGVEALLRWQHPDLGLVLPNDFVPLLEETGLIVPVGEWVLRTACEQIRAWSANGTNSLRVAINLSGRQFDEPNFTHLVEGVLQDTGIKPELLEFEITESVLMRHAQQVLETLQALNERNIHLAVDDFGTGYSSLGYLKRFPVHSLKIDRSFIHDVTTDPDDAAIVKAIFAMAHSLKLLVVAEGVETAEHLEFLRAERCQRVQGFLFSRPVTAEQIPALIEGRKAGRRQSSHLHEEGG